MKKLPVGIENFAEIRKEDFYYVDKTKLIADLLRNWGKVNLFTRPRRFGKTLNMSMLKAFFEIGTDEKLFAGLAIAEETALCEQYMGKYPVVFISLKGVDGLDFKQARDMLSMIIANESRRFTFLAESNKLSDDEKSSYLALCGGRAEESILHNALTLLSEWLTKHYGQKTILLIDEYDVPLDKAFQHGYYTEMVSLIRTLFGQALKTNDNLYFAVLTGCLRVSKESIFTGLNNFSVNTITDTEYDEQFGFTDAEVLTMLNDYGVVDRYAITKEWYDGYRFGNTDVYCPWDVINYVKKLRSEPEAAPQAYWINTSGNDLVRRFVDKADRTTQDEIERLIAGEAIEKAVRLELTYNEVDKSIDNLWSVLFTTGYLTHTGNLENGKYKLVIPNLEVREVFILQIQEWFKEKVISDSEHVKTLCRAFERGEAEEIRKRLTAILGKTISVLDTKARDGQKENFYHGILLGLLRSEEEWLILSNAESGEGFSDILVEPEDPDRGIIIEVKYAQSVSGLKNACEAGMKQILDRQYDMKLRNDGRTEIYAYCIAFNKKRCDVVFQEL